MEVDIFLMEHQKKIAGKIQKNLFLRNSCNPVFVLKEQAFMSQRHYLMQKSCGSHTQKCTESASAKNGYQPKVCVPLGYQNVLPNIHHFVGKDNNGLQTYHTLSCRYRSLGEFFDNQFFLALCQLGSMGCIFVRRVSSVVPV